MTKGEMVAEQVKLWDRTPFHPQQRARGHGVDCKGLVWGVAEELGFAEARSEYALAVDYNLSRANGLPSGRLEEGFRALFDQVEEMEPGDILLCLWGRKPGHIAVYSGDGRAWSALPGSGVRSRKLTALFAKFPLHSIWRWRAA